MKELPALTKAYEITNWIMNKVEKIPRAKKFTLGVAKRAGWGGRVFIANSWSME